MGFTDNVRKAATDLMRPLMPAAQQAIRAQGMGPSTFVGPSAPVFPADGISNPPRGFDYPAGYNIAARPRSNSRMSFASLTGLIDAYDIAQIAITHRIDTIRALKWSVVPEDGVTRNLDAEIEYAIAFFKKPDRRTPFNVWLSKYLWDLFAFDAPTLYKMRNNADQCIGLKVVDGRTIAPLIDQYGDTPTGAAPAYVQFIHGASWEWLLDSDIIYQPFRPISDSVYGRPPIESVVLSANTDLRMQMYFMQKFTDGNIPAGFGISPDTWTPQNIADWQESWDAQFVGNAVAKSQIRWVPGGSKLEFPTLQNFDTGNAAAEYWWMQKTAAAFHVTPDALGFTNNSNRSVGESQADVGQQIGDVPTAGYLQAIFTDFLQSELGLPLKFEFDLGGVEEDRLATAQADAIYIDKGVVSASKISELRFGIVDSEVTPKFIFTNAAGPIPLSSLFAATTQVDPETGTPINVAPDKVAAPLPIESAASTTAAGNSPSTDTSMAKSEAAAFIKFVKARAARGTWRDFEFTSVDATLAAELNRDARAAVLGEDVDPKARAASSGIAKGWRDTSADTPQNQYDLLLVDHYAPLIADAIQKWIKNLPIESAVSGLIMKADAPDIEAIREKIKAALNNGVTPDMSQILDGMYADGWVAGEHAASVQLSPHVLSVEGLSAATVDIDWENWVPGDSVAAAKISSGGFAELLARSGVTIGGMTETMLDQIGNSLADGIAAGDSIDTMRAGLLDLGMSMSANRADIIAHTESTRAIIGSTMDVYHSNGVAQWNLVTVGAAADELCQSVEASNPHDMKDQTDAPPLHPYCRCSAAPEPSSITAKNIAPVDNNVDNLGE